jgi:hypothetical protein
LREPWPVDLMADLGAADMASSPPVRHMISENIRS